MYQVVETMKDTFYTFVDRAVEGLVFKDKRLAEEYVSYLKKQAPMRLLKVEKVTLVEESLQFGKVYRIEVGRVEDEELMLWSFKEVGDYCSLDDGRWVLDECEVEIYETLQFDEQGYKGLRKNQLFVTHKVVMDGEPVKESDLVEAFIRKIKESGKVMDPGKADLYELTNLLLKQFEEKKNNG